MDTGEHLLQLFAYNRWANLRIIAALGDQPQPEAERLAAHIVITESEYIERLSDKDSTGFDFWPALSLAECRQHAEKNFAAAEELLSNRRDDVLDRVASYRTSEGVPHRNSFRELLTHMLLHSATHRGAVVTRMRAAGLEPPQVDYIIYMRENG